MSKSVLKTSLTNGRFIKMRAARINDIWRYVNDVEQYRTRIKKVEIKKLSGFEDITIEPQSAITAICGKNGVGKTTFLKLIYQAIKSPRKQLSPLRFGVYDFQIEILDNRSNIIFDRNSEHHL
ncbi:ATP-binding cassette domain-containing protein, partial [Salmonella enterica]|nr:ATP-binding cassette domain-containing protein [Salmonella enterica]